MLYYIKDDILFNKLLLTALICISSSIFADNLRLNIQTKIENQVIYNQDIECKKDLQMSVEDLFDNHPHRGQVDIVCINESTAYVFAEIQSIQGSQAHAAKNMLIQMNQLKKDNIELSDSNIQLNVTTIK